MARPDSSMQDLPPTPRGGSRWRRESFGSSRRCSSSRVGRGGRFSGPPQLPNSILRQVTGEERTIDVVV